MTARILIVEDNAMNRELVDYLLRSQGFETAHAADGAAGLALARQVRPDLVLSDIQMPGMDGLAFAHAFKQDERLRDIPLIAVTAYAMVGDRSRVVAAGFDGYVTKPIDPPELLATVTRHLEARAPSASAETPTAEADVQPRSAPRPTVLVVDDSPMNLELKRSLLEPHGYEVRTADTARAAFELAVRHPPDLIISDVGMRQGTGFDFIRQVKAEPALRDIPFIFLSSTHWDPESRQLGLSLGAVRYLVRPIDPALVLQEVRACIGP